MSFIKWLFTNHYFNNIQGVLKFVGTIFGIFLCVVVPEAALEEYYGGWISIWPVIIACLISFGYLTAIIIQPYLIYKKLKRLGRIE